MSPFPAIVGGGLGGLGGAILAHLSVTLGHRFGSPLWLKGPYGPPFFDISLYMGVLCGGTALGLSRRLRPTLLGLLGPSLGIVLPMMLLTRVARWGAGADDAPTLAWVYAVEIVYIVATWGTILGLGWVLVDRRRWLGALAGAAGSFAGYLLLAGLLKVFPTYKQMVWSPTGLIPSPVELLDGLLTGTGLGAGVSLIWRQNEKTNGA